MADIKDGGHPHGACFSQRDVMTCRLDSQDFKKDGRSCIFMGRGDLAYFLLLLLFNCCYFSRSGTPWTVACRAPLSTGFSRQEYWCGLLFPFIKSHMLRSSKALGPQLFSLCCGAREPQLVKAEHCAACAPQGENSGQWEAQASLEATLWSSQGEKRPHSIKDSVSKAKINT